MRLHSIAAGVLVAAAAAGAPAGIGAQAAAAGGGGAYPNVDRPLIIAAGDSVQLLSRMMHDGGPALRRPGRRLDFVYSTSVPASDAAARAAQADRAAQMLGAQAIELGVRSLSIAICDTRACAQRRDPPAMWYLYERTHTGWQRAVP